VTSADKETQPTVTAADKAGAPAAAKARQVEIPPNISVRDLAALLGISVVDAIKHVMRAGVMANINQLIDFKTAQAVATNAGIEARLKHRPARATAAKRLLRPAPGDQTAALQHRPPVITIMGHVDHGKTKLLDAIRQTNVVDQEAGGITQHIGAYQVDVKGQKLTFLDTPGHEAFTSMRARGAQVTDITVLVVAADDGVMPQTLEAIDHARAAGVPIIVAINKIDKAGANPDRVKQQLAEAGLVVEDWGGDTIAVPVSAREKRGIPELLESIMLVAEMEDLKADPTKPAEGTVIEAKMDRTRGALFTVLVSSGTLKEGDVIVVGDLSGKVKAMFNDAGKRIKRAGPANPAEVLGLDTVPQVGDIMTAVSDDKAAQAVIEKRRQQAEQETAARHAVSLSNIYEQLSAGKMQELNIILKVDVQGSLDPIRNSLEKLSTDQVKVHIIRSGSGNVTESDVLLAIASKGVIIGFNTDVEPGAKKLSEREGTSIRNYQIIYNLVEDVEKALKGLLKPAEVEVIDGHGEVRALFTARKEKVAGVYITEGKVVRGGGVRVMRGSKKVHESTVGSLKRFKEDVREVATGYECGVGIDAFNDFQTGDVLEFFHIEKSD